MGMGIEQEVAELRRRLERLQSSLQELQKEYAREVRTQQVTVEDGAGIERVILSARHQAGSVLVRVDGPEGQTTGTELYAAEDPDGGAPEVGLCLIRRGDVVSRWREG